ncbi:MAG: hypothetical protein ACO3TT_01670, partial [Candidatus Puniceispirillales bacterium]
IKKVIDEMAAYYAGSGLEIPNIKYVVAYDKNGKETVICDRGVGKIEDIINEEVNKVENYDKEILL